MLQDTWEEDFMEYVDGNPRHFRLFFFAIFGKRAVRKVMYQ